MGSHRAQMGEDYNLTIYVIDELQINVTVKIEFYQDKQLIITKTVGISAGNSK